MEKTLDLRCPNCRLSANATLDGTHHRFIVYTCPKCRSNVVYFKNKIDIIPDRLFRKLLRKRKLVFCGDVSFFPAVGKPDQPVRGPITHQDIVDLKILLETEKDSFRFISKL